MPRMRDLAPFFPKLASAPYRITSPQDERYNCFAWAAGDEQNWWEPDAGGDGYWPCEPRNDSLDGYIRAFESVGFTVCGPESRSLEPGFIKVALFAIAGRPTHAARQLENGLWTSKLGR